MRNFPPFGLYELDTKKREGSRLVAKGPLPIYGRRLLPEAEADRIRLRTDFDHIDFTARHLEWAALLLRTEVARAIREYAAVIQDVIEPVHGSSVRDIIVGGAAPLESILINGLEPRVPPIERRMTFEPGGPEPG